ncbi:MAG: YdcF family protein [Terriglobales bacterium]
MRLLLLAAVGMAFYLAFISSQIVAESYKQELHPADAIVVFGAAQYDGHPSPVFRARLDHAFELFKQGLAPTVLTTGGSGADPSYSECGVGHDYLVHRGIPESRVIAETQGSDTSQSAERLAVIMRANHMHSCIAVSDAYHVFRIRNLLAHEGVRVYVSPRPDSRPHSLWQRGVALLRESASFMLWKLDLIR